MLKRAWHEMAQMDILMGATGRISRVAFSLLKWRHEPAAILLAALGWRNTAHLVHCGLHHTALSLSPAKSDPYALCAALEARAALAQSQDVVDLATEVPRWPQGLKARAAIALTRLRIEVPAEVMGTLPEKLRLATALTMGETALARIPEVADADSAFLAAAVNAGMGDHRAARRACNAGFAAAGLRPLVDEDAHTPLRLDSFLPARSAATFDGPLVSVVIAARNAAATVAPAIRSLLGQSWWNLEIVLVDDCSTDATIARAREAAGGEPRLTIARLASQSGPYAARNIGMRMARGAFIGFSDADDIAHVDRIALQLAPLLNGGKSASVSRLVRLDECGRPVAPRIWPFVRLNPSSLVLSAPLAQVLGPFRENILGADGEYLARLSLLAGSSSVAWLRFPGTIASQRQDSLTGAARTGLSTPEGAGRRTAHVEDWVRDHVRQLSTSTHRNSLLSLPMSPPPLSSLSLGFLDADQGSRRAIWT
jgi:hypothetical protein